MVNCIVESLEEYKNAFQQKYDQNDAFEAKVYEIISETVADIESAKNSYKDNLKECCKKFSDILNIFFKDLSLTNGKLFRELSQDVPQARLDFLWNNIENGWDVLRTEAGLGYKGYYGADSHCNIS